MVLTFPLKQEVFMVYYPQTAQTKQPSFRMLATLLKPGAGIMKISRHHVQKEAHAKNHFTGYFVCSNNKAS
jgi:hypothetical protein